MLAALAAVVLTQMPDTYYRFSDQRLTPKGGTLLRFENHTAKLEMGKK